MERFFKDNQALLNLPISMKENDHEEVDMKAVDNLLKNEMSQLSYQDRYLINQDVHGMNVLAATEPNELYSIGLDALDRQLLRVNQIHDGDNDDDDQMRQYFYHRLAGILNSPMIKSKDFRSKFARSTCFDPVKAADRIEMYFEIICENFGNEALTRPVRLTDLNKVERDLLKSGCLQILPYRDLMGRRILCSLGNFGTHNHTTKNKIKVFTYVMQVLSEDEETQKQGSVLLFWPLDPNYTISRELDKIIRAAPIRFSAIHFMLNDTPRFRMFGAWKLLTLPKEARARTRIHIGSINQCQQEVTAYGISSHLLPVTNTGNIKNQNLLRWLAFRQTKEHAIEHGIQFNGIECPLVRDVLTGKGPHVSSNPANVDFRKLMESRFLEHRDAFTAERKTVISREIVDELVLKGGRFLIKEKSWWVNGDRETAREKVSVAFRDMRKTFLIHEKKKVSTKRDTCPCGTSSTNGKKTKMNSL
mmetsp:Transcript_22795/g.25626  ORF Transcript_22795/g.25626 Transcript_22795/m.25626 type:complete len:475 (+) Transcript_22795:76-1500(+)|eukprot:CAMPEP_0170767484 /NCGR_PEP_ID=MMETSP0733-20121128/5779_1 /TAXON_ID=186038 /ORGANISM="Fragilariopsis kerguelensis, Strain L26-C5" /LENGTH=474 /DNA_ID=CAMNT_0011108637 /DNA_START=56 /DNA_END=1480 /DNA_ORIENTATION=+